MEQGLKGKRVAILAGDDVEGRELSEPREALEAAGATTKVVSPKPGPLRAKGGEQIEVDCTLDACKASEFDALLLPGGRGATALAKEQGAVQLVREFMLADKPVAAICHGAALLVAADAVAGRKLTSAPDLQKTVVDAGGEWDDTPVKIDDRLITSRGPNDLPHFTRAIVKEFANRLDEARVDQMSEQSFPASDPPPGPSAIGGAGAAESRV
jgi:protease I